MGADAAVEAVPEVVLRELRAGGDPVGFVARVVTCERREVTRRSDNSRRPLLSGLLSDGTATVRFTWWDPPREGIERGTVLRAVGAVVGEFRGRPEVTFNWRTRVGPASPAELPKVDPQSLPLRTLAELRPPEEGFRVRARVVRVAERGVSVGEERRVVFEGLLADRSGSVGFSSWSDFNLRPGEAVEISGGYLRTFRSATQLVLDDRSTLQRVPPDDLPEAEAVLATPPRPIFDVEEAGGAGSVCVEGIVVGLLPPSGLIYRCPECRRSLTGGVCRQHGAVTGQADLRARLVLDDGTGAVTVNADRAVTERLWGVTLESARTRLREEPDSSLLEADLQAHLFGRRLRVRGRAAKDDFGLTVTPDTVEPVEVDLDAAARELFARLAPARP